MTALRNIKFRSRLCIFLDEVDIEQILINNPVLKDAHPRITSIFAARETEEFKAAKHFFERFGYTLRPSYYYKTKDGRHEMSFWAVKHEEEQAA